MTKTTLIEAVAGDLGISKAESQRGPKQSVRKRHVCLIFSGSDSSSGVVVVVVVPALNGGCVACR